MWAESTLTVYKAYEGSLTGIYQEQLGTDTFFRKQHFMLGAAYVERSHETTMFYEHGSMN